MTAPAHDAPLRVSVSTDAGYLPHVAAMLHSLLDVDPQPIEVHLLHAGDVTDDTAAPLAALLTGAGGALHRHAVDRTRLAHLNAERFPIACWYRVLLPELVDADRILHLDGDALVVAPLGPLWRTDLEGLPFAAVHNPLYPWMRPAWKRLGLPSGTAYLNSGVMLLDLPAMRAADATERVLDFGARHPENPWPEQDALSAVFPDGWLALHPRWNVQSTITDLRTSELPFEAAQVREARSDPAVLHFSGAFKPWDGWGARRHIRAYFAHRAAAGYPAPVPRRPLPATVAPLLPKRARRAVMMRTLEKRSPG